MMIGYLTGTYQDTKDLYVLILTGSVGYAVFVTDSWRTKAVNDSKYSLYIYTHVKEDALELYGFGTENEKRLFVLLLSVSGVGTKTALSIVNYGVQTVQDAIYKADVQFFSSIPRIGKKNAQKIIIELKNKLGGIKEIDLLEEESGVKFELIDAFLGLGFERAKINDFIQNKFDETVSLEKNIKSGLQYFGGKRNEN